MKLRKRLLALACTAALAIQLVLPVGAVGTGDTAKNEYPDYYTDYMIEALEQGDTIEGDDYTHKDTLFTASMVHNNPGLEPYTSNYNNSQFLADRSIDEQVFFLYDCAQYGLLWDKYDQSQGITLTEEQWKADPDGTKAQNDRKVFPYGSEARAWVEAKRADLHKKYDAADAAGVDVYFMMDMIVMPAHLKAMRSDIMSGKIDITKPEVQKVMDFMFQEMFTEFPTIDGIYIRYGETYTGTKYGDAAPYHTGNNPILHGEQSHMTLINYMSAKLFGDKRVDEAYRDVIYRTWGFGGFQNNPSEYLRVSENVRPNEHLYFCIKHSTGDFHRDVAFNQTIGIGQHQQIVEVQCAREYEGKGAYPNFLIHGVINGMEEYEWLNPDDEYQCLRDVINSAEDPQVKGIWIWPRGGGWNGPYINGVNGIRNDNEYYGQGEPRLSNPEVVIEDGSEMWNDLNAYVVTQWAKDTSKTDKYYVKEYAKNYLGMDEEDAENFYKLCILSEHAVLLGRGTNDPSVQSKCNNTWWTRDQNIAPGNLQNNINKAVNNNLQGTVLREKAECVAMWKEMLEIAQGFKTDAKLIDSPTVGVKDYIITTCKYGYYFFDITQQMYIAGIEKAKGEKNGECDINAIHDAVSEYDRLWAEWEELYETAPGCPSLFAKEDQSQNLIGYSSNRGTDAFMKNYRESLSMSGGVLVEKGGTAELPIQYSYGANPEYFTFESSDNSIATVDKDGIVTGVAAGKCLVTVRTKTSLAASTLVIVSEEGTLETETLFNETFETEDSEGDTANWGGSNGTVTWADGTIQVSNGNNSNGRTLSLNGPHTGKLTVSWRMKVDNTSDRAYVRLKDSKGLNLTQVEFRANQSGVGRHKIIIDAGSPDYVVSLTTEDYAADTWYDVKVDIDTAAGTYTVTIGDDSKSFTHFKDSDLADVNLIEVVSRTSNVTISIDDIRVTATLEAKITAKDIADSIHSTQLRTDEAALVMPVMPSGYTVSVKSAEPAGIVGKDGSVTIPDKSTTVNVIFQVTSVDDPSDTADTAPIKVAIPAAVHEVIRVACVGDSITFGSQSVANTRNYPTALQEKLGAGYLVKNFGVSGATMRNTADKPYTKQPEYAASKAFLPDIVIIMLGTNDGKSHNWSIGGTEAAYTEDAVALIEAYRSLESKPEIYFMTSPTAHDRGTAQSRYKIIPSNVNEEIVPLQGLVAYEEKCHFIDMNLATKNAKDYFPDDIHANNDGYELIGETVYRALIGEKTYLNPYALTAVILEAERKNADLYTEQSYQAMQEVLAQAKETQANATAQSEFDAAYEALKTALAALEEKPRDPVISQNKPVSASSQEAANPASKAVDGNINSLWAAQGDSYPQSITVDFEGLYDLSELELYMPKHGANDRAYQFKVLVAGEDQQFKQVVDQTQNTDKSGHHIFALDESQVRYIKIQVVSCNNATNSGKNAGVNEIIVRGIPSVSVIPVTSVELDKTELTLTEGENAALRATVNPDNATNKNVTWSTSNASVATVENGKVTAVAEGTVTITVTTVDGNKTATCTVTVKKAVEDERLLFEDDFSQDTSAGWTGNGQARVEDGALVVSGGTSGEMVFHLPNQYQGDLTVTFKMKVNNATDRAFFRLANSSGSHIDQVEFRGSYAPGCVVVDTGKVGQNPDQVGQYTPNQYVNVKIELNTYNKTQTITVNGGTPYVMDYYKQDPGSNTALGQLHIGTRRNAVFTIDDVRIFANKEIPVTGVTLNSEDFSLYEGQTKTVAATVEPFNATQKGVSWSTSNDDVVTVVDGKVTAVGAGEADITVITLEGNKSDSVHVKVLSSLPVQTIPYTDKNIRYVGRWLEEDGTMAGYWCGASFEICFKGYSCKVDMSADSGVIATVDGIATNIGSPKGQVDLSDYLDSDVEEHVVRITAKDYRKAKIVLRSIQICSEKGLEAPDDRLLIEVIGDSITAGATMGNRCVDAYGNVCARLLDADCAFVAHDSISLLDKHSGGGYANVDGMNKQYFKTKPWYYDSTNSDWDFSAYTPDVVIINLGTNDHGNRNPVDTPEEVQEFIQVYCDFVDKIHEQYGKDTPVLMMIPFQHLMEEYMREIYSELSEKGSCVYLVESADWVTKATGDFADNYHPNAGGHQKIGKKLAEYIEGILAAPEANPVTVKTEGEGTANANVTEAKKGDTVTLTATPAKDWHFVEWKSEDIVVDENNTFTMPAKDVTVTAVFEQDEAQTVPVESVILDKASVELKVGKTVQLAATVLPENATNKAVIWSISDASVATVENGLVTAVAKGTATITVTTEDGDKTATCAVTVKSASGNGGSASQYTITVQQADGGMITPSTTTVKKNDSKTFTIQANEGYVISDVLVDGSSVGAVSSYTFKKVISKHTITAVFEKVDVEESGLPFTDVKSGDWYHDAVEYVYGEGLMAGTSGKLFTPNGILSRGMIVQILYSLEGRPEVKADRAFDDVKAGAWYADAVNWAASVGMVSGYGNGKFGPDDSITREQLAAILRQYAALKGCETKASGKLDSFADADQVSGWAVEAVQWAVGNSLMSGKNGGMLDPKGTATRAETAVILMQFCENVVK